VKYREEKGNFKSAEDLKNVQGIGDKMYEKISSEIEVGK
jgi:competence protein ComEA